MTSVSRPALSTALWLTTCALIFNGAPGGAAEPPTALAGVASGTPQLEMPSGEPQKLVPQAQAPGSEAPSVARGEGKVSAGRPVAFLFRPEASGLFSIGISSPQSAARISIYLGDSTQPATGTAVADGAIRWSTDLTPGDSVKIVVYTAGPEIPFRVEAIGGPGSV